MKLNEKVDDRGLSLNNLELSATPQQFICRIFGARCDDFETFKLFGFLQKFRQKQRYEHRKQHLFSSSYSLIWLSCCAFLALRYFALISVSLTSTPFTISVAAIAMSHESRTISRCYISYLEICELLGGSCRKIDVADFQRNNERELTMRVNLVCDECRKNIFGEARLS
jgi:hypothetical protein